MKKEIQVVSPMHCEGIYKTNKYRTKSFFTVARLQILRSGSLPGEAENECERGDC